MLPPDAALAIIDTSAHVAAALVFAAVLGYSSTVETSAPVREVDPPEGGGETVLVVEDEAPVRALVVEALTASGYAVLDAGSGPAALWVWQRHGARVDLVLCDMVMPDGLNGVELVTRLRGDRPGVRVVLMSGYQDQGDRVERAGFLAKPFSLHDLLGTVRRQLDAPAS